GARAIVAAALALHPDGTWLDPRDAAALLACFGIPVVAFSVVTDAKSAVAAADELGYPVALKTAVPEIVHKTDVGGVVRDLSDSSAVEGAWSKMSRSLGDEMGEAIVQRMV